MTSFNGTRLAWPRRLERLEAAVIDARNRLATLGQNSEGAARITLCKELIDDAERAACSRGLLRWRSLPREYLAWDYLAQCDRHMVHAMGDTERAMLWASVLAEAEHKLEGHRKQALLQLRVTEPAQSPVVAATPSVPSADQVCAVMKLLHTHSQNEYHKIDQIKRQIDFAAVFLTVLVFGLLSVAAVRIHFGWSGKLDHAVLLGTVMGLFGGVLSLAFTVIRSGLQSRIPTMRNAFEVARIRPLIGAAMALPVILILEAGVISFAGVNNSWVVAAASFLAGFSERWFLGLVEGLENRAK